MALLWLITVIISSTCINLISSQLSAENGQGRDFGNYNEFEACWERCYQIIDDDAEMRSYKPAYFEFYEMGMEARRLKNMRSVNGTVMLIDSTLSEWHEDSSEDIQDYEKASNIWKFQMDLATITTIMQANNETRNPLAIVQFNEKSAWTCSEYTCLDHCEAAEIFQNASEYLTAVQTNSSSHWDGRIEPACRIGYLNLHDTSETSCTADIDREMAIALVNSDFRANTRQSDEYDDYSPCDEHFDTRYAIGTHHAHYRDLKKFSSLDAHSIYIKDNPYTMKAADELVKCMRSRCCGYTTYTNADTDDNCVITTDEYGENIETFAAHPNYAAKDFQSLP